MKGLVKSEITRSAFLKSKLAFIYCVMPRSAITSSATTWWMRCFSIMKQLEDESRSMAKLLMADLQEKHRRETSKIGRLLSLYVDDSIPDPTTFGEIRRRAWKIMPWETLKSTAQHMSVKPISKLALQWQAVGGMTAYLVPQLLRCETGSHHR